MMKAQVLLTLFFLTAFSATVSAQDERLKRLDEIFKEWRQPGIPGAAVTVIQGGKNTMVVKAGKLVALHPHHGVMPLTVLAKDRFSSREWFMPSVVFGRDASDRNIAATLGGGRVAGIRFTRK